MGEIEGKLKFVVSTAAGKTNFRVLTRFDFQFRNSNWINFDHWSNMDLNFQKVWTLGWFQRLNDHFYDCGLWFPTLLTLDSNQLCSENNPFKDLFPHIIRIPKIVFFWLEYHLITAKYSSEMHQFESADPVHGFYPQNGIYPKIPFLA